MKNNLAKDFLGRMEYEEHPIWRYDDSDELNYPVLTTDDLGDSIFDLSFKAKFSTPTGRSLDGYIVGFGDIFSIGLFANDKVFFVNKNLASLSKEQLHSFLSELGWAQTMSIEDIFPLSYSTGIYRAPFIDFEGVFDMKFLAPRGKN
ncbi:hypothetical protein [Pseudomonas nitroreducens]|uniref:hypothetical protein n=1 Tax=Pseudomonas nitroreducens TaxID=46680 RepID=UPI0020A12E02|nr:hypothetical protein [Pseudomonas nitroreducens]MCP1626337.1 hypothetical protein [Pseudomonas nitroreducens]